MLPNSHDMNEEPRAGYGQPSAWSQRLGAGLAAASCCLLVLEHSVNRLNRGIPKRDWM